VVHYSPVPSGNDHKEQLIEDIGQGKGQGQGDHPGIMANSMKTIAKKCFPGAIAGPPLVSLPCIQKLA